MLYSLDDYVIVPSVTSRINSRSECCPYVYDKTYPIFTAPMSSVINENNYEVFQKAGVRTIIPRNVDIDIRLSLCNKTFIAVSLTEFEQCFCKDLYSYQNGYNLYICIDIANGHMQRLLNLCATAKRIYGGQIILMTGNIANPHTYLEYAKVGIDYIRCSIGSGGICTTAANTGCYYSMASLIEGCREHKIGLESIINKPSQCVYKSIPKIVADGGFQNFDQINKAIALGADYVMLGGIFAKTLEACGEIKSQSLNLIDMPQVNLSQEYIRNKSIAEIKEMKCYREYYGMSTKRAQTEISGSASKTAEGITKIIPIEYTLEGWLDNFSHYLRSAMSYCDSKTLYEFRKRAQLEIISPLARIAYFK